jgi:uncharacterized protein YjiS (DUF1127 family)
MILFKAITEKLHGWLRYRGAVTKLSQLSDREVSGIRVNRGNIECVAREGLS